MKRILTAFGLCLLLTTLLAARGPTPIRTPTPVRPTPTPPPSPIPILELYVPEDYPGIQEAIDAAEDGDTVVVSPGTYIENIDLKGKDITLRSTDPNDPDVVAATIIDGGGRGSVVTFMGGETSKAVLAGFTITNGSASDGGGIYVGGNSSPTIKGNTIGGNLAESYGGGIYVDNSSPRVTGNTFENNEAREGGAIWVSGDSTLKLNDPDDNSYIGNVPDNIHYE